MRLMLVDDHAAFREVVKTVLKKPGMEFLECETGQEAVAAFPRFNPDFVLMDIAMKGLDGLQAAARIKNSFPGARILMLTQYDDADLREAALKAGACGYVLKEDLAELEPLLRQLADPACVPDKAHE